MIEPRMRYEKKYAQVLGRKMAYVEAGEGDPIVFFHGNITSSYMWRNVIPHVEGLGRCIAIDNIGQGDSEKLPGSMYRLRDHQPFTNALMDALGVTQNVTIVTHDWGAQLGFTWASERQDALKGVVICQGVVGDFEWSHWPPEVQALFKRFRSGEGEKLVLEQNFFVEKILPAMVIREVSREIHDEYRRPYRNPGEDRRPTLTWPREIPIEGEPADVLEIIERNNAWLEQHPVPKLFINSDPGAVLVGEHRSMIRSWPNVKEVTVAGLHYCHEDSPDEMGRAIAGWYASLGLYFSLAWRQSETAAAWIAMKPKIGRRKFLKRAGLAGLGALGLAGGCAKMGLGIKGPTAPPPEAQGLVTREAASLYLPHGGPGKWFNPWWPNPGSRVNLYKWKFLYRNEFAEIKNAKTPEVPVVSNDGAYLSKPQNEPSITSIGHCGFVIQDGPNVILTDPHFGAGAFWHGRRQPPGVPAASIPKGAAALISHNHYDHLDSWTIENLPEDVTWYVPMGLGGFVESLGRRAVELDWWRSAEHGGARLTCLPAQHWSNRFGMARDSTLWCSWLVETGGRKYYHGGDSGYFQGFREFGRKFGPIDVAMLSIGAYEPRWMMRYSHMNPAEGLRAFHDLGARWMIPMHWGTFDLTDEPLDHPPRVLKAHMAETGADASRVRIMAVGERWRFL